MEHLPDLTAQPYRPMCLCSYVMELQNGFCVDAKFKGNLSRFINHR